MYQNLNTYGCVLDKSGTDGAECRNKVASEKSVAGAIRSLVNVRSFLGSCMSHCSCLFLPMVVRQ